MRLCVKEEYSVVRRVQREVFGVGLLTYTLREERQRRGLPKEYGIGIQKMGADGEEEECYISSVTTNRGVAARIFRAILLGEVTPCTLTDVVMDLLVEM